MINGKPIIQWIIDESYSSGVKEFLIVTGYESEKIGDYFNRNPQDNITLIYNPHWEKGNGISVLCVEKMIKKNRKFILMMSDHLIESNVIKTVVGSEERCPLLTVERNLDKVLEIEDATKVFMDNEGVRSIGKDLRTFNGVDTGFFLLDRSIFYFLKESMRKGDDSLTAGIREMIEEEKLHIYSIPEESYWIDVDSVNSYKSAKQIWRRR